MAAVLMLLRTQRNALRSWITLALLLAVVGGGVLAAGAGARRTDTAYPRFLAASNNADVLVTGGGNNGNLTDQITLMKGIASWPQIDQAGLGYWAFAAVWLPSGKPVDSNDVSPIVLPDQRFGRSIGRFTVLDGRLADSRQAGEAVVSFPLAEEFHLHVGDMLRVRMVTPGDLHTMSRRAGATSPAISDVASGPRTQVRITGVIVSPLGQDFPPLPPQQGGALYLTPAFFARYGSGPDRLTTFAALPAKLRGGQAAVPAFQRAVESYASAHGTQLRVQTPTQHEAVVQDTIHLQAVGIGLIAALAAAVLVLVLGQGVARRIALDATDNTALHALGATRGQLWAVAMLRATGAGALGALGAVALAVALSPLTPIGNARLAEPDPGLDLDVAVVLGGAAALLLIVAAMAALPAWRAATPRGSDAPDRGIGTRLSEQLGRAGLPATAVSGVRLALEPGRGRSAVPVRGAIVACAVATATVAAALGFSASLGHLLDSPHLYGWNWDAEVSSLIDPSGAGALLGDMPGVAAFAQGTTAEIGVGSDHVGALAIDPGKGDVSPVILSGRVPAAADEIMLGAQTAPGTPVGGMVDVRVGGNAQRMRLVGRGVMPVLSDTAHLGTGAWLTLAGLQRLLGPGVDTSPDTFLVRTAGDPSAAHDALVARFGFDAVLTPSPPQGLVGFGDLSALPIVLAGVLAAGAVATLVHAVGTSVRRRRHDLAVLKTLGFVRRQVALTVAWQATTLAALAAVIGIPLGTAAGRWAWTLFADQQGVVSEPVMPLLSTLLLLPAALLLANLVAAIPGRFAARTSPALVLRSE
jgi:ABC-type lipoprotein release transport system permease subunit